MFRLRNPQQATNPLDSLLRSYFTSSLMGRTLPLLLLLFVCGGGGRIQTTTAELDNSCQPRLSDEINKQGLKPAHPIESNDFELVDRCGRATTTVVPCGVDQNHPHHHMPSSSKHHAVAPLTRTRSMLNRHTNSKIIPLTFPPIGQRARQAMLSSTRTDDVAACGPWAPACRRRPTGPAGAAAGAAGAAGSAASTVMCPPTGRSPLPPLADQAPGRKQYI